MLVSRVWCIHSKVEACKRKKKNTVINTVSNIVIKKEDKMQYTKNIIWKIMVVNGKLRHR